MLAHTYPISFFPNNTQHLLLMFHAACMITLEFRTNTNLNPPTVPKRALLLHEAVVHTALRSDSGIA